MLSHFRPENRLIAYFDTEKPSQPIWDARWEKEAAAEIERLRREAEDLRSSNIYLRFVLGAALVCFLFLILYAAAMKVA